MILKKQGGVDAGYESSCSILNELKVTEVLLSDPRVESGAVIKPG